MGHTHTCTHTHTHAQRQTQILLFHCKGWKKKTCCKYATLQATGGDDDESWYLLQNIQTCSIHLQMRARWNKPLHHIHLIQTCTWMQRYISTLLHENNKPPHTHTNTHTSVHAASPEAHYDPVSLCIAANLKKHIFGWCHARCPCWANAHRDTHIRHPAHEHSSAHWHRRQRTHK